MHDMVRVAEKEVPCKIHHTEKLLVSATTTKNKKKETKEATQVRGGVNDATTKEIKSSN